MNGRTVLLSSLVVVLGGLLLTFKHTLGFPVSCYCLSVRISRGERPTHERRQEAQDVTSWAGCGNAQVDQRRLLSWMQDVQGILSLTDCEVDRRKLLSWGLMGASILGTTEPTLAAAGKKQTLFLLSSAKNATTLQRSPIRAEGLTLSVENCLLNLLPVENKVFRKLEAYVDGLSSLRSNAKDAGNWRDANRKMQAALNLLDSQRRRLEPEFNQEDSAILQIAKGERGEQLIGSLRDNLVALTESTKRNNQTETFRLQKKALLALSDIGELLVASFPYHVPAQGKFSYLPRLMGRARVTFAFQRDRKVLGNVTIVADGFAAPITAGNFVDLSARQFYTGLPIKPVKKRFGQASNIIDEILSFEKLGIVDEQSDSLTIPILGDFNEGFYDPLTAKLRRIPLELLRIDEASGASTLSYAEGFSDVSSSSSSETPTVESSKNVNALIPVDIPGLVFFNHPDKNVNGGSSAFFSLQMNKVEADKVRLFDGVYAPFGFIVDGYDVYQNLKAGDIIESTTVGEWGLLNLVKIRGTSFSDVLQSDDSDE